MPRWKKKEEVVAPVSKMDPTEIQGLRQEIAEKEAMLAESKNDMDVNRNHLLHDESKIRRDIARKKEYLAKDEDAIAKGRKKDSIAKEIRELEERIVSDRPTTDEMNVSLGTMESARAVRKNMEFHQKHGRTIERIQVLRKLLEPDDPSSNNMEYLRPDVYRKSTKFHI